MSEEKKNENKKYYWVQAAVVSQAKIVGGARPAMTTMVTDTHPLLLELNPKLAGLDFAIRIADWNEIPEDVYKAYLPNMRDQAKNQSKIIQAVGNVEKIKGNKH